MANEIFEPTGAHSLGERRVGLDPSLGTLGKEVEGLVGTHWVMLAEANRGAGP